MLAAGGEEDLHLAAAVFHTAAAATAFHGGSGYDSVCFYDTSALFYNTIYVVVSRLFYESWVIFLSLQADTNIVFVYFGTVRQS